jgi:NADPH-dependent ferric siderophore reductase
LPAVRRRLEELPADAQVIVLLQVDAADRQLPARPASTAVQWLDTTEALHAAVAALQLPAGEGFAWAAGEAAAMAALRPLLVDKGLPKEQLKVAAYWKAGAEAFHENLDA